MSDIITQQFGGVPLTAAEEHNNPGNLRVPGTKTGEWQHFDTPEAGFEKLVGDLEGKRTGKSTTGLHGGSTIRDFTNAWAPSNDPYDVTHVNKPDIYAQNISKTMGVTPDTPIGQLNTRDWAAAVANQEDNKYWSTIKDRVMAPDPMAQFGGTPVEEPDQLKTTPAPGGQTSFIKPDLDPANQALRNTGLQVRKPRGPDLPEGLKPDNPNAYAPSGLKWALPAGKEIETGVATMSDPSMERKAQGLHQVASGAAQLVAPAILAGAGAPIATAARIGAGMLAQKGVVEGGKALDVPEGYRNIAGDVVGAAVAGLPRRTPRAIGTPSPGAPPEATVVDKLAQAGRNWFAKGSRREVRKWPGGDYIVEAYDALTRKPKPAKPTVVKPAKPTPDPKPASAREVQAQDILKRANVNREDLAGPKNPVAYSDIPADPGVSDPRALSPEYMPETNPAPTASPKDVGVMRGVLERSGQGQLPTRTPRPLSDPEVGKSTADFDAPASEKPIIPKAPERFKTGSGKNMPDFTPGDNQYGAPGRPTTRGEFTPPDEPVVEAAAETKFEPFKTSPRTQRLVRGRPADNPYGGSPGAKLTRNGPPPPPKVEAAVEESVPDLPAATPAVAGPKPDAAAAAKALADEMGVTKIEPNTPPRSRPDKRAITTVNQLNSQMKAAAKQDPGKMQGYKHMTVEEFNKLPPKEQKAIRDRMKELPKLGLGGVIQTVSAQKSQVRRSRRGVAYGPPSLMRGMNPPSVPRRKI